MHKLLLGYFISLFSSISGQADGVKAERYVLEYLWSPVNDLLLKTWALP